MASSSPQQTSLVPGKVESPVAPKPEAKKPDKKISDIGKPQAVSPLARMAEANQQILVNQEKMLKTLEEICIYIKDFRVILYEINEVLHKKTGIFQVAAQQAKPKQQEKASQQTDNLPADLRDLSKEDRDKLVSCPGGVKLKHFYPDKSVWTKMNFDILEPKGYKWKKDEQSSKNSHWQKGG